MANVGGPNNNQPQPDLQAFKNAADGARDNTQIKVDSNTGNVGTRSLFGRAWRAVTSDSSERRASNMRDINSFKVALSEVWNRNDQQLPIESALDRFLPGRENGNVPLTAGAVRRSIEEINIKNMPVESAVDDPRFRDVAVKQYATENLDFYTVARDMLGDGSDRITVKEFRELVELYIDPEKNKEQTKINISHRLQNRMTQFAEHTKSPSYSAFYSAAQSEAARQLLQEAQREIGTMMESGVLLSEYKKNLLDQR